MAYKYMVLKTIMVSINKFMKFVQYEKPRTDESQD